MNEIYDDDHGPLRASDLRAEWQEALTRTLKSPTFEEWLKARQLEEGIGLA